MITNHSTVILGAGLVNTETNLIQINECEKLYKKTITALEAPAETILVINQNFFSIFNKFCNENGTLIYQVRNSPKGGGGALASAALGVSQLSSDGPILIAPLEGYVDSETVSIFIEKMTNENMSSGCIIFKSQKPNFSYVRKGPEDEIVEIAEKRIIGDLATTGIFYFASRSQFLDACSWAFTNNVQFEGKFYLAPCLNYYILKNLRIGYLEIPEDKYFRFSNYVEIQNTLDRMEKN